MGMFPNRNCNLHLHLVSTNQHGHLGRYRPAPFTLCSSFMSIIWPNFIWSPYPCNFHIPPHGGLTFHQLLVIFYNPYIIKYLNTLGNSWTLHQLFISPACRTTMITEYIWLLLNVLDLFFSVPLLWLIHLCYPYYDEHAETACHLYTDVLQSERGIPSTLQIKTCTFTVNYSSLSTRSSESMLSVLHSLQTVRKRKHLHAMQGELNTCARMSRLFCA